MHRKSPAVFALVAAALAAPAAAQTGLIATTCRSDIQTHCASVPHLAGAVPLCLAQRYDALSIPCQAALRTAGPRHGGMDVQQILTLVEGMGYTAITEIEYENGRYEVKATDADRLRVELYIDAVSGDLLKVERDD